MQEIEVKAEADFPNYKILFKFPTRSRPQKALERLNEIKTLSKNEHYNIWLTLDSDDETILQINLNPENDTKINAFWGKSNSKIHAVNRDIQYIITQTLYDWDILVVISDDMHIERKGFDNIIRADMFKHFPDLDGVLHYNDGNHGEKLMTLSIMGRKYYERFDYVYHPDYISLWADLEAQDVAKILRKYVYLGDENTWFRHMHPAFGLAEMDEQYKQSESKELWDRDEQVYNERKSKGFDLAISVDTNASTITKEEHREHGFELKESKKLEGCQWRDEFLLSILIRCIPEHEEKLKQLIEAFQSIKDSYTEGIEFEILTDVRPAYKYGGPSRGQKCNNLKSKAKGMYIMFVDADDMIFKEGLLELLDHIHEARENLIHNQTEMPDVFGINGIMTTNGTSKTKFEIRLGNEYKSVRYFGQSEVYLRFPNHITPIKRQLVDGFDFEDINEQEDYKWACFLRDSHVLVTEHVIEEPLYHYRFLTK